MSNLHRPAADASGLPEKAEKVIQKDLSFASMSVTAMDVGEDCLLLLQGGSRPHIGCTVLAVPRPSLKNPEEPSSTASVLNVSGHKDEYLCRYLAEKTAARTGKVTVCTGGFHTDHITDGQIREGMDAMEEILASL